MNTAGTQIVSDAAERRENPVHGPAWDPLFESLKKNLVCLLWICVEYKLLCFYFCSYFASQLPARCHSLYAQIQ